MSSVPYPRAAVAVTLQSHQNNTPYYLLVQRANAPDLGKWSLPGGKIDVGEKTLEAGQRELTEETLLAAEHCQWHPQPFITTDAIVQNDDGSYAFHFLVAHCFAKIDEELPKVTASDDALDAKWFTLNEIQQLQDSDVSQGTVGVIQRAESLYRKGELL
jgi:ADP-ribose pyrophosphatase YjhB (NUDIX family)